MSTESSLDPQLIEQTKQQIRSLVGEIAQLSKEELSPEEFYGQFLTRVVSALAAVGGAVWTLNDEGRLALQYQINIQQTKLRENEEGQAQHARLLYKVLSGGEGALVPPHSGAGEEEAEGAANPTDFLLVLGPLRTDLEAAGVLEVFQRPEAGPNTQKGYLRFMLQMCELAGDYLKSHQLRHFSHRQALWTQLEDFTRVAHTSLDPRETAYTIANEGRRLIECDRLSVAIRKGHKCHVEAISGQDLFDKRSNIVRLLGKLATAVVATDEPVWYTGETRDMAPQVEDAVQEYVDESHSKTVAVLPLKRPPVAEEEEPDQHGEPEPPIAALIVEQIEDSRVPPAMVQRVEVVSRHSATALANALEHQNLFLMPLWRTIGKAKWVLHARTLPKTLAIIGVVLAVLIALAVWPANFKLHSKGTLEPTQRHDVFADIEGVVAAVSVKHGDAVAKDQLLATLRNTDLEVEITDIIGQRATTGKQILSVRRRLKEKGLTIEERNRLYGELAALNEKRRNLDTQFSLYQKKREQLEVRSPLGGRVMSWDLYRRLINRPVQRGQVLMEVANPAGRWELELHMPEDQIGFITKAQIDLYENLRKRLRKELRAALSKKLSSKVLEAEVAKAPDAQLSAKLRELLGPSLRKDVQGRLKKIIKRLQDEKPKKKPAKPSAQALPDGPNAVLRRQLNAAMQAATYAEMRAALRKVLRDAADADLRARLQELLSDGLDDRLPVSFQLETDPGRDFAGKVQEIHRRAEVRGDEGNTVLIKVAIEKEDLPSLRSGATVNAKVYCGRRSIGYVWFHDFIAFVQSRILFRYF